MHAPSGRLTCDIGFSFIVAGSRKDRGQYRSSTAVDDGAVWLDYSGNVAVWRYAQSTERKFDRCFVSLLDRIWHTLA